MLSARSISRLGFSFHDSVYDLIDNGILRWTSDWFVRYLELSQMNVPTIHDDTSDVILWRDFNGHLRPFSVSLVWDSIKLLGYEVDWYHIVWFPYYISRQHFTCGLFLIRS